MLVLTRLEDETIVIGDPANPIAVVTVVSVRGEKVRIGIQAAREIPVHRGEVAAAMVAVVGGGEKAVHNAV